MRATEKYGHTNDTPLYSATLDKATEAKVNWNTDKALLEQQILPSVWKTDFDQLSN